MRRERKLLIVPETQGIRPYGVGIDVAKDFHAVCVLIPKGTQVLRIEFEVPNTPVALRMARDRVMRRLRKEGIQVDAASLSYCCESTATYHYPLIRTWGGRCCLVNPGLATSFKARKTDRIDAYKLATQHWHGLWPESVMPTAETEVLRLYTRTRKRLRSIESRCLNGITTRLWQWNCGSIQTTARHKQVRACIEDLAAGRYQAGLVQFAEHKHVPAEVWDVLCQLYGIFDAVHVKLQGLERKIDERVKGDLSDRLLSLPGVGAVTVATWCAEVE